MFHERLGVTHRVQYLLHVVAVPRKAKQLCELSLTLFVKLRRHVVIPALGRPVP